MAIDSLAARRAVREHLEANFDEYLSSVATYLRQAYPDLQLSNEVSEEIAATVIVRVSHANPEPEDIEKALSKSADDVVRSRRPRLSQAKLLEDVSGPLRSEFPRALPSLRLVQSFSRTSADGETSGGQSLVPGTRLVLANPPLDLGASIGFGGARTSEPEPEFSTEDEPAPGSRTSTDVVDDAADDVVDDAAEVMAESGTLSDAEAVGDSRVEPKHVDIDDAFEAGQAADTAHDAEHALSREVETFEVENDAVQVSARVVWPAPSADTAPSAVGAAEAARSPVDAPFGADSGNDTPPSNDTASSEDFRFWDDEASDPVPQRRRLEPALRPSRVPAAALDAFDEDDDVIPGAPPSVLVGDTGRAPTEAESSTRGPASHADAATPSSRRTAAEVIAMAERALHGVAGSEAREGGALFAQQKLSSVPPTQESLIPTPVAHSDVAEGVEQGDADAGELARARTRRKVSPRGKKATTKPKPRPARSKSAAKRPVAKPALPAARERPPVAGAPSGAFVADDLAVLAMLGFPSNPRRAALLCVTAVSEELGVEGHVDLTPFVRQVVVALEELRGKWERTSSIPPDAHLQWQRAARQATLRAFLGARQ